MSTLIAAPPQTDRTPPAPRPVIETVGLTKRYGRTIAAVLDLDLTIRHGEVYGLVGPNGAGKTTTLRMLLGLVRPTSGRGTVLGLPLGAPSGLDRVGALIETPAFYPYLSGRSNLRILARLAQAPLARVDEVLAQVDLLARADDRFATYSLGMKQRLGVAAALLKDPDLLILDEPMNGLDPQGRADMRSLVRTLGQGSRTVVLSSHLMEDVEQICDRVGVLQAGRLITETTVAELRGAPSLLVRAEPSERTAEILAGIFGAEQLARDGEAFVIATDPVAAGEVARRLVMGGVALTELRPVQRSLEAAFLELTGSAVTAQEGQS
jgi:ABC-type multidrug transport system ATPase subunit